METKEKRVGSLDVLRVLLSLFVIILHFNNSNGGGALKYTEGLFLNHEFTFLTESFAICAVNVFMILSGYFLGHSQKRGIIKPILLFFVVIGYNSFFCLIDMLMKREFSLSAYIHSLIPINYFVWIYIAVYFVSPWINVIFEHVSKKNAAGLLLLMFILFSVYPGIVEMYCGITGTTISGISTISAIDSGSGYTFVNFAFMYCIGAYIGKYGVHIKKKLCLLGFVASSCMIYIMIRFTMNVIYYNNPFVIASAVFLFLVFQKSEIRNYKAVKALSDLTFQIFIIHCCLYAVWDLLDLPKRLSGNGFVAIMISLGSVLLMYVCSVCIALLGRLVARPLVILIKKLFNFSYTIQNKEVIK